MTAASSELRVRLDVWLWAARFFKTRALAKKAIEGGKVQVNGQRPKPAREVVVGAELRIRRGEVVQTVTVEALSDRRGGAPDAQRLYRETADSVAQREAEREQRRLLRLGQTTPARRPDKRDRRQLQRLKHGAGTDAH